MLMVRPAESHQIQGGNLFFFWLRYFFSFSSSCTEEREELADLDRCEGKDNEDKEEEEMRRRSYTQESKTELFFRFFGQDNFFIFAEKCSSFSSSCKERWEACRR